MLLRWVLPRWRISVRGIRTGGGNTQLVDTKEVKLLEKRSKRFAPETQTKPILTLDTFIDLMAPHQIGITDNLAVAVSGGADSMALLITVQQWFLKRLQVYDRKREALEEMPSPMLTAIHVDHQLRDESSKENQHVKEWANTWGIPLVTRKIVTTPHTARDDRYDALIKSCEEHNIQVLFTGHHLDDQLETFLMRLTRYSGVRGLGGIQREVQLTPTLRLIRPLLTVERSVLQETCRTFAQAFINDPTNFDMKSDRSRIRLALHSILHRNQSKLDIMQRVGREGSFGLVLSGDEGKRTMKSFLDKAITLASDTSHRRIPYISLVTLMTHMQKARENLDTFVLRRVERLAVMVQPFNVAYLSLSELQKESPCLQPHIFGHIVMRIGGDSKMRGLSSIESVLSEMRVLSRSSKLQLGTCFITYEEYDTVAITKKPQKMDAQEMVACSSIEWKQSNQRIIFCPPLHTPRLPWSSETLAKRVTPLYSQTQWWKHVATKQIAIVQNDGYWHELRSFESQDLNRIIDQLRRSTPRGGKRQLMVKEDNDRIIDELRHLPWYAFNTSLPVILEYSDTKSKTYAFVPHLPGLQLSHLSFAYIRSAK